MTGLDTNVLVRFLVQDDPAQGAAARALFATLTPEAPGFVAREVIVELVWVLERAYRFPRPRIAEALAGLLEARELLVEDADRVGRVLDGYAGGGAGFSDRMIWQAAGAAGCAAVATFDRQAAALPLGRLLA